MKIMISPAKQMREDRDTLPPRGRPVYRDRAAQLVAYLRELPYRELKELLACGDKLARQAYDQYQVMDPTRGDTPALLAYSGIQYRYMAPQVFESRCFDYVQNRLRILSGLYGILRPFDGVSPYRLEMQAKAPGGLYRYWGDLLYRELTADGGRVILNLASQEYSRAVSPYLTAGDTFITCTFGQWLGGRVVEKGVYVKMARGEMVRWMAERNVEDPAQLRDFGGLGFAYRPDLSSADRLVFLRD